MSNKRDYACPKCKNPYRLEFKPEYYCNCIQRQLRAVHHDVYLRDAAREFKGIKAVSNPIDKRFYTKLVLLPELNSVFGIPREGV